MRGDERPRARRPPRRRPAHLDHHDRVRRGQPLDQLTARRRTGAGAGPTTTIGRAPAWPTSAAGTASAATTSSCSVPSRCGPSPHGTRPSAIEWPERELHDQRRGQPGQRPLDPDRPPRGGKPQAPSSVPGRRAGRRGPGGQFGRTPAASSSRAGGSRPSPTAATISADDRLDQRAGRPRAPMQSRSAPAASARTAAGAIPPAAAAAPFISSASVTIAPREAVLAAQQVGQRPPAEGGRAVAGQRRHPDVRGHDRLRARPSIDRGERRQVALAAAASSGASTVGSSRCESATVAPWPGKCLAQAATPAAWRPVDRGGRVPGHQRAGRRRTTGCR